jgi:hypothetical protein
LLIKSWNTSKSFGFVPNFLEKIETFSFCKKEVGTHQKVLVLFQNFGKNRNVPLKVLEHIKTFWIRFDP